MTRFPFESDLFYFYPQDDDSNNMFFSSPRAVFYKCYYIYIYIMAFYETHTEFRLFSRIVPVYIHMVETRGVLYALRMSNIHVLRHPVGGFSFETNIFAAVLPN
jgi:hypothetical protein